MEKRESQGNMYTLKELLDEYVFIIPDYQRDYAQGRSNPRDEHVLALFVEEISKALLSGNHLYLDYVYGDIEVTGKSVPRAAGDNAEGGLRVAQCGSDFIDGAVSAYCKHSGILA